MTKDISSRLQRFMTNVWAYRFKTFFDW